MINYQLKFTFPMLCICSPCCCIPRIASKTFVFCPESASIGRVKLNWLPLLDAILLSLFSFHPSPRNSRTLSCSKRILCDSLPNLKELTAHTQTHFTVNSQRNSPRRNQLFRKFSCNYLFRHAHNAMYELDLKNESEQFPNMPKELLEKLINFICL